MLRCAVRRRFPGHSEGTYGRLVRLIDELGFIGADFEFQVERLWCGIVRWFAALLITTNKLMSVATGSHAAGAGR